MQPESLPVPPLAGSRCIVTGGLGFIGSNLVHELVGRGADVTVIDAMVPHHGGDRANVAGLDVPADVRCSRRESTRRRWPTRSTAPR